MSLLLSLFLLSLQLHAQAELPPQLPLPHLDENFGCFSPAEASRYQKDYKVDVDSFGGPELCDNTRDNKKLLNDFYLIEKTEFDAPVEHPFIRGFVDRNNYYGWMKSQTRGVRRGHDIPYATAYNSFGYFTMQDGWATLSTLGRVGTIIHEARHTAGYRHTPCTSGPYANSSVSGCDVNYGQGGSHGVEMEYYARVVLEAKNLHPVYQSMARLMALGRSNFVFNTMPMQKREAFLAAGEYAWVLKDGDQTKVSQPVALREGERLKRTSFGASLFDGEHTRAVDLYTAGAFEARDTDDYSYFKLFATPRDRAPVSVRTAEEVDAGNLRYFVVLSQDARFSSFNFPQGNWFPAVGPASGAAALVTRTPSGQAGLFAVTPAGEILPFDLAGRRVLPALSERWPADTAAFALYGSELVALLADGRVVHAGSGAPVAELDGYRFSEIVNVPLYDAFQVVR